MNKDLYSGVFNNKYLSTKIFNIIHEIQIDRYSLKYEDIVDVGWMFRHGHIGVAREKINSNNKQILYIDHIDLFSIVANTDTNLFISLYEQNRYTAREYLVRKKNVIFDSTNIKQQLKNKQVIKYLYDREFKDDILEQLVVAKMDPEVIEYLLEIGWFRVSSDLIKREFDPTIGYYGTCSPPKVLELLLKHFKGPIPLKDSKEIIRLNLISPDIPTDLSPLLPLLHPDIRKEIIDGFEQTVFDKLFRILDQKNNRVKKINHLKSIIPIVVRETRDIMVLEAYAMWSQWTREGGQDSLFDLWNTNVNRIRVCGDHIYYHTKHDLSPRINEEYLVKDTNVVDIGDFLKRLACVQVNLSIFEFLHKKGFRSMMITSDNSPEYTEFYSQLAKLSNKKDVDMIVNLSMRYYKLLDRKDLLKACCRLGLIDKFKYYFELIKKDNDYHWAAIVPILFKEAANHGHYHMYRVIESYGQETSMGRSEFKDLFIQNSFKCLEKEVDKIINSDGGDSILFLDFVEIGIKFSDFLGVKTLLNKYLSIYGDENFGYDKLFIQLFGMTTNLTIIDYLSKHQSLFFMTTGSIQAKSFFKNVLEKALQFKNLPLVEYLLKYKCLETNDLSTLDLQFISKYFDENNNIIIK
ncbi:hypothetical protein CYY_005405 [Polysphondylium violaceum]|uniref:Ankyrin repeat protein n=1 Tax=Polysphondylium violaceum TaxID=133409 RepID=A0A8J4US75_9MYCE|nr:hypothetical protein CYY_005405 [Polysphondylium violaceum]